MAQSKEPALAREVRARGHHEAADKLAALHEMYAGMQPTREGHRVLSPDEIDRQAANQLTADEMEKVQEVEYSTYVAKADIPHGTAHAYRAGHPVPVSAVERYGYDGMGLVERVAPESDTVSPSPKPAPKVEAAK